MKHFISLLFCLINALAFSQDIVYVKVFVHLKINAATFSVQKSTYNIIADDKILLKDKGTIILKLTAVNDSVEVKSFETVYGRFKNVCIMLCVRSRWANRSTVGG